jgi:hypothetical protein
MGLVGSKALAKTAAGDSASINYMLNMDMIGRLNQGNQLVINGAGTSPAWSVLDTIHIKEISRIKTSESGVGPSDHTSFYLKGIPVLHFFTGQHRDYHKPSDDSHLVNYQGIKSVCSFMLEVIEKVDDKGKLAFNKTKDEDQQKTARFKVTLGVMPDYVYNGEGMRIDAVIEGGAAFKGGLEDGDVVIGIGDVEVKEIYTYMEALSKFEKGNTAVVKVKRGSETLEKKVTF